MTIRIVNSLTRKKEELVPASPVGGPAGKAGTSESKIIRMYSCGVTVYDRCHIGHARSLYIFEVIRRYLKYRGYDVRFARNITDVDDKIINKARETKKSFEAVVAENIAAYYEDLKSLGIPPADVEPRATENIPEMIKDIDGLIQKGFAYVANGDVYYDVRKFKDYGKLSGQSVDKMMEAVRIEQDGKKKDPLDFALWKKSKEDEPFWESPWGRGRPGWHIECSCMSRKHLGCETLDIHAGGRDLIFPHHENEIAQAEPLTNKPFAKYWIHHGLLTINGQKMAKSLGNFITVQDALKKYSVDQLKLFFLSSHYASPIDFTPGKMEEAHRALQRFEILLTRVSQMNIPPTQEAQEMDFIGEHREKFFAAMDDDFNTPKALGHLFDLVTATNKFIDGGQDKRNYAAIIEDAVATVTALCTDIFGLSLSRGVAAEDSQEVEHLLKQREQARAKKDFKRSDKLRDALKEKGIIVEDSKDGQVWRRA